MSSPNTPSPRFSTSPGKISGAGRASALATSWCCSIAAGNASASALRSLSMPAAPV